MIPGAASKSQTDPILLIKFLACHSATILRFREWANARTTKDSKPFIMKSIGFSLLQWLPTCASKGKFRSYNFCCWAWYDPVARLQSIFKRIGSNNGLRIFEDSETGNWQKSPIAIREWMTWAEIIVTMKSSGEDTSDLNLENEVMKSVFLWSKIINYGRKT